MACLFRRRSLAKARLSPYKSRHTSSAPAEVRTPRFITIADGGGDADTTENQRDMLDLTMTNAWSATTTAASTHTRHRGTEELSEI